MDAILPTLPHTVIDAAIPIDDNIAGPSKPFESNAEEQSKILDWGDYKAAHLRKVCLTKESVSSSWSSRRRPIATEMSASQISDEYVELAKIKKEAAKLHKNILQKEIEFKRKEHKLKIEELEIDNKIKQLQLKLLEEQCIVKGIK